MHDDKSQGERAIMAATQESKYVMVDTMSEMSATEWYEKYSKFKWALSKNNLQNSGYINKQKWYVDTLQQYLELQQKTPNYTPNKLIITLEMYYITNEYIPDLFKHNSTKWRKYVDCVLTNAGEILDNLVKISKYKCFKHEPYYASLQEVLCDTIAMCNRLKSSLVNCEDPTPQYDKPIVGIDGTIRFPLNDTAEIPIPIIPLYL